MVVLILLAYPLVGRLWCAICPFMVWEKSLSV